MVMMDNFLVDYGFLETFAIEVIQGRGFSKEITTDHTDAVLINEKAANDVLDFVGDAVAQGARVAAGGQRSSLGGCFIEPTLLTHVSDTMRVFREEIFGPVAPLFRFKDEAEVIAMANDTEFGLASYFYARDLGRVWRVAEALEYGIVGINTGIISNEMAPFGGVKESGQGREGSKYGLDDYLEIKYMCLGGIDT
jgi:succinate-semialdehyde dehydrogenase/glutarate-semialdehyde dehydrogenase